MLEAALTAGETLETTPYLVAGRLNFIPVSAAKAGDGSSGGRGGGAY